MECLPASIVQRNSVAGNTTVNKSTISETGSQL